MCRQLKFRIRSNSMKRWLCEDSQYLQMDGKKVHAAPWSTMEWDIPSEEYIIQQFTELYDKNKKPIYEGDRVRFGYTEDHEFFGEVIWLQDRASFGVRYKNTFETFEDVPMDHMNYFEVIGNIFENPELLNK
jgi:uncharacterized phage protein (TIGR01671 family)